MLSIYNFMELANIINPKMYGDGIHHRERHAMISGRKVSRELIETLFSYYELVDEHDQAINAKASLVQPYLAQQAKCLLAYKAEAVRRNVRSDDDSCTYTAVVDAFRSYCVKNHNFLQIFNSCEAFDSFAWAGPTWHVRRRNKPLVPQRKPSC